MMLPYKFHMPRTKSAKKALRQNIRHRAQNETRKTKMKTQVKNFKKLVAEGKLAEAKQAFPQVMKAVDKAVKNGYIKKGNAARTKSRLSKKLAAK